MYQGEDSGDLPFYKVGDIAANVIAGNDCLSFCNNYISYDVAKEIKGSILPKDVVVFAKIGEALKLNRRAITTCNCLIDNNAMGIAAKPSVLDVRYFFYFMKSVKMEEHSESTTVPSVRKSKLENIEITVPDIQEQQQIAATLDKLQSIIAHRKQQLAKLDELVKARFVEMFSEIDLTPQRAEWIPISSIGTVIGGSTPKTSVEEYWDGDLKWITPAELLPDTGYLYDSVRKITKAGVDSCSLQLLPKDTVILTSRAPIGKVAIAGTEMYCNQGFKNIICNDTVLPRYLYSLLLYNVDYLNSLGRGATFKEISKSIVEKIKIPIAPIEQQNQFAAFVEQTNKSKVAVQKSLDEAQVLFDSLMQEYFG